MELRVHKVHQAASGGSHVTIYEADVELVEGGVREEILVVDPQDSSEADVEMARQAIRRGAERILQPRGLGAVIRVGRVVLHPVDFNASKFEKYTAEALAQVLANSP